MNVKRFGLLSSSPACSSCRSLSSHTMARRVRHRGREHVEGDRDGVDLVQPSLLLKFDVKGEDGTVKRWAVEGASHRHDQAWLGPDVVQAGGRGHGDLAAGQDGRASAVSGPSSWPVAGQ